MQEGLKLNGSQRRFWSTMMIFSGKKHEYYGKEHNHHWSLDTIPVKINARTKYMFLSCQQKKQQNHDN